MRALPAVIVTANVGVLQQGAGGTSLACSEFSPELSCCFEWHLYTQEAGYNSFLSPQGEGDKNDGGSLCLVTRLVK